MKGIDMAANLEDALKDTDAIVLLVNHTEFRNFNPAEIAAKTKARVLIDCVHAWDVIAWQKAGFELHLLGDNKTSISDPQS
jgi:UDP-N-acetyl-D-mannosaminuronate dehydrogenase